MHATVCICTRDRGESIATTLRSIRASTYQDFDVVIVDQSASDETERAVRRETEGDGQFTYIRSQSRGASAARNIAVDHARGSLVAFTDDDCEVASDWLERIVAHFRARPSVGLLCGAVLPGPHDPAKGFIPAYIIKVPQLISSPWHKWRSRGISANMTFPRDVLAAVGPFDEVLGPGAPLRLAEDFDITYRVLKKGFIVLAAPDVSVVHHGFRTWEEAQTLMRRAGLGTGAAYMKHLRLGDVAVVPTFLREWVIGINWQRLLRLHKHSGLAYVLYYGWGAIQSFHYRIDRRRCVYCKMRR